MPNLDPNTSLQQGDYNNVATMTFGHLRNNRDERRLRFNPYTHFFSRFYRSMIPQTNDQDTNDSIRQFKMEINSPTVDDYITLVEALCTLVYNTLCDDQRISLPTTINERCLRFYPNLSRASKRHDHSYITTAKTERKHGYKTKNIKFKEAMFLASLDQSIMGYNPFRSSALKNSEDSYPKNENQEVHHLPIPGLHLPLWHIPFLKDLFILSKVNTRKYFPLRRDEKNTNISLRIFKKK